MIVVVISGRNPQVYCTLIILIPPCGYTTTEEARRHDDLVVKMPFTEPNARASKQPYARGGCCGQGRYSAWMGDHRLPKRVMPGELENAGKRGPGGKEKEWTDCVADDLRLFGVTGDWRTAALDPGAWYNTIQEGGCKFMAAWVREEENASNQRQEKREAEEADKVEVAPGVTVASLRRFRTALIGPTHGLPKRRRLCR